MARRAKGEGTLRKRSDGRWEAWLPLGNGKHKTINRRTKAEVVKAVRDFQDEQAKFKPSESWTFGDYAKKWLEGERRRVAVATYLSRKNVVDVHGKPLASKMLNEIGKDDLERILWPLGDMGSVRMNDKGELSSFGPATRSKIRNVLHLLFRTALREDLIARNPVELLAPERETKAKKVRALEQAELHRFFKAAKGHRWEAFFRLALVTGARPGELVALQWEDIDFKRSAVTFRASIGRESADSKRLVRKATKTKAAERTLGVPNEVLGLLQERWERVEARGGTRQDLVFSVPSKTNPKDRVPVNLRNLNTKVLAPLAQKAKIQGVTLYDFRHTFATQMIAHGEDLLTVAQCLGHTSVRLLLSTYGHVLDGMKKRAAQTAGNVLRDALHGTDSTPGSKTIVRTIFGKEEAA